MNGGLPYTDPGPIIDRDEALMFISDLVGSPQLVARLTSLEYKIKFVQFADILADSAEDARGESRRRFVAGLRSLLLVPILHETSIKVIEDYLKILSVQMPYTIVPREEVKDRLVFRQLVRRTFVAEGVQASLVDERPLGLFKSMARNWSSRP